MSNAIDLYPLTLDQVNNRVGIKTVAPTTRLDVTGDAFVRANVTSTSNVQAAAQFKLGGSIGDDTSLISEGTGALNVVGKRYVPVRGQPFEVGAGTLRYVNVYDILDTTGAVRTSTSMKIGGLFTDTDSTIGVNNDGSSLNFVGKGRSPYRLTNVQDLLNVEGPVRVSGKLDIGAVRFGSPYVSESISSLNLNGRAPSAGAKGKVAIFDDLIVNGDTVNHDGVVTGPGGTLGPTLSMKKGFIDIVFQKTSPLDPYIGSFWFVESGNVGYISTNEGFFMPVISYNFRYVVNTYGFTVIAGTFSPSSSPGETISWSSARLIWRGVALDDDERDLTVAINVHQATKKVTVATFNTRTYGSSQGYSTTVTPWFQVSAQTSAGYYTDTSYAINMTFSSSVATTYRLGRVWMQFRAN